MFLALTWGQERPGDDLKSSLFSHALYICITLMLVAGEAIALHSYNALTTRSSVPEESLGAETFGIGLIALFWGLYYGLKWQLLPSAVYARHLEGSVFAVLCVAFLIILWAGGVFDRR